MQLSRENVNCFDRNDVLRTSLRVPTNYVNDTSIGKPFSNAFYAFSNQEFTARVKKTVHRVIGSLEFVLPVPFLLFGCTNVEVTTLSGVFLFKTTSIIN